MELSEVCICLLCAVAMALAHDAPSIPGVPPKMHHQPPASSHQHNHHNQQNQVQFKQGAPPHGQHRLREGARDRDHVLDHLDGMVKKENDLDRMSEDEVQFHYFKLHDYDNNNMLDGIELISALTHYHKDEDPNNTRPLSEPDLKNLVDTILKEDDRNNDGYVDYTEFIVSQRA